VTSFGAGSVREFVAWARAALCGELRERGRVGVLLQKIEHRGLEPGAPADWCGQPRSTAVMAREGPPP
jgi:hypothetical protein